MIGVNHERDLFTKRFIIAHELDHYILHGENKPIFAQREKTHGRTPEENEIDFFAACLLMFVKSAYSIQCNYGNISDYNLAKLLIDNLRFPN